MADEKTRLIANVISSLLSNQSSSEQDAANRQSSLSDQNPNVNPFNPRPAYQTGLNTTDLSNSSRVDRNVFNSRSSNLSTPYESPYQKYNRQMMNMMNHVIGRVDEKILNDGVIQNGLHTKMDDMVARLDIKLDSIIDLNETLSKKVDYLKDFLDKLDNKINSIATAVDCIKELLSKKD